MFILQLVVVQVIIFGILIFILRKLLYGNISSAVQRFEKLDEENQKKREDLQKGLEKIETEYREKVMKAQDEVARLKNDALKAAQKTKSDLLEQAMQESAAIITKAVEGRERMRAEIAEEMEAKTITMSCDLIQEIFSSEIQEGIHEQLVSEIVKEFEKIDPGKMDGKIDTAEIVSPYPLNATQRDQIRKLLNRKWDRSFELKEETDKSIIAGLIIKLGGFVIDGSLTNRLRGLAAYMRSKAQASV